MATLQLVEGHRRDLAYIFSLAEADLLALWLQFGDDFLSIRDGLTDVLPELVDTYGGAASALGADWYEEMREAAGVTGRFAAVTAILPTIGRTNALAGWATTFARSFDAAIAQQKTLGGLQRIIANADRETVMESSVSDRKAKGWKRVGGGDCGFCQMLIGRGAVYSEATADFRSHDNCKCSAVPVWD